MNKITAIAAIFSAATNVSCADPSTDRPPYPAFGNKSMQAESALFDWRNYIKLDWDPDRYYNPDGTIRESYADGEGHIQGIASMYGLVEEALDQISLIPEFQQNLIAAHALAPARLEADEAHERMSDPRMMLRLGHATLFYSSHTITLNMADLMTRDPVGGVQMSLQRVLIHESFHAADPRLIGFGDEPEILRQSVQEAIDGTLEKFPQYAKEYEQTGQIAGVPFSRLLETEPDAFASVQSQVLDHTFVHLKQEHLDNPPSHYLWRSGDPAGMHMFIGGVLNTLQKDAYIRIVEERHEIPVIERTNAIMGRYYGDPARRGYALEHDDNFDIFDDEKIRKGAYGRTYERPLPDAPLAPTAGCSGGNLQDRSCDAVTVRGATLMPP